MSRSRTSKSRALFPSQRDVEDALLKLWREEEPEADRKYGASALQAERALDRVITAAEEARSALRRHAWGDLHRAIDKFNSPYAKIKRCRGAGLEDWLQDIADVAEAGKKYL